MELIETFKLTVKNMIYSKIIDIAKEFSPALIEILGAPEFEELRRDIEFDWSIDTKYSDVFVDVLNKVAYQSKDELMISLLQFESYLENLSTKMIGMFTDDFKLSMEKDFDNAFSNPNYISKFQIVRIAVKFRKLQDSKTAIELEEEEKEKVKMNKYIDEHIKPMFYKKTSRFEIAKSSFELLSSLQLYIQLLMKENKILHPPNFNTKINHTIIDVTTQKIVKAKAGKGGKARASKYDEPKKYVLQMWEGGHKWRFVVASCCTEIVRQRPDINYTTARRWLDAEVKKSKELIKKRP